MDSTRKAARVAGLLYPLLGIGIVNLIYVPRTLIVRDNAAATAANITAHETLFRLGIVSGLVCAVSFIFVVLALYRLLKGVNQNHAALMVIFVLISVAISFVNELNNLAALTLLSGADYLSVFRPEQLHAMAMLFLRLHGYGSTVNSIFWGLWLFPFGLLVYRSHFLPRILGVWLIINCFGYLASSFTTLLLPQYREVVSRAVMPALLGELAIMLWLLIKGAKDQPLADPASSAAGG
jgi:hypothetical protein